MKKHFSILYSIVIFILFYFDDMFSFVVCSFLWTRHSISSTNIFKHFLQYDKGIILHQFGQRHRRKSQRWNNMLSNKIQAAWFILPWNWINRPVLILGNILSANMVLLPNFHTFGKQYKWHVSCCLLSEQTKVKLHYSLKDIEHFLDLNNDLL